MKNKYSMPKISEHMARALGKDMPVSPKMAIEICNFIRGKDLGQAKRMMRDVIDHKIAVPLKRFNMDVGHKPGKIGAGRYPEKACGEILKLLESAEANAQNKGLSTGSLIVKHLVSNMAGGAMRGGRQRGRQTKSTHIEVVLEETKRTKDDSKKSDLKEKDTKSKSAKTAAKPAVKPKVKSEKTDKTEKAEKSEKVDKSEKSETAHESHSHDHNHDHAGHNHDHAGHNHDHAGHNHDHAGHDHKHN